MIQNKAITANGDLYCWGLNSYGQVGNGTTVNQLTPLKILENVKTVNKNSAITTNGDLYCWGYNTNAQVEMEQQILS